MKNSTLFSFGFAKYDYIPPVVLNLFDGYENTTVNGEPVLNYVLEVYEAVLDGRIDLEHHFSMIGYIKTIQENNKCTESKRAQKVTYFVPDCDDRSNHDAIIESHIESKEDMYAKYDDADELKWAVDKLNALLDEFILDYGVHIIHVMKKAANGFPQAKEILKKLCDEVDTLSELVYIILSSGQSLDELFPEEDTKTSEKSEIVREVEKVIDGRENPSEKVVSINRGYDNKDENIQKMRKIGLDAYKVGTGAYIAFSADIQKQENSSDIVNL